MSVEYEFLTKVLAAKNNILQECVIANRNLDHRQTCVEPLTEPLWLFGLEAKFRWELLFQVGLCVVPMSSESDNELACS